MTAKKCSWRGLGMKNDLIKPSLFNTLGVAIYCSAIAYLIQNGERIFGKTANFWGPFAFLMLFVVSAAIVGSLVFGKPVILYLNNQKKEAVTLLGYTIMWLFIVTVIVLLFQFLIKI